jgi:hypothetical protein
MGHLRRLSYSTSLAVILTALLTFLVHHGSYADIGVLLLPGVTAEFILTTLFPHGDGEAFGYTDQGWASNVVIYSLCFYALFLLYKWVYENR